MITLASLLLGAFFNRVRGGLADQLFPNNKIHNIIWKLINAVAFGMFCGIVLHNAYAIPAAAIGMFIGAMFKWGTFLGALQDGLNPANNLFRAAIRGLIWTGCIALSLFYFSHNMVYFIPVGLLFGLPYYKTPSWARSEYIVGAVLWGTISLCLSQ